MKIKILKNTDGYLGGWGISKNIKENDVMIFDIPQHDLELFHKTINCRDMVEILDKNQDKFDVQFGELKLKFNDIQNKKLIKETEKFHKFNKNKNDVEKILF